MFFKLLRLLDTPERSGSRGEHAISSKLNTLNFFNDRGKVLQNIYVPTYNGETTEIDLLFLTTKGIFVIESKNYSGYIFGNENNKNWTSTLYVGKTWYGAKKVEKHHFYNPIWQNKTHIKYLGKYLVNIRIPIYSVIVFSDRCEFKALSYDAENTYVCHLNQLKGFIKSVLNSSEDYITTEHLGNIYMTLSKLTNVSVQQKEQHIKSVEDKKANNDGICPYCKSQLVLRTAKNGPYVGQQFWGCSNYPNCRYIKNI